VAQALTDSRQQLAETIEKWGQAMTIERFFRDAEERLALARAMMGSVDPLDFIENWQAHGDRYRSKYDQSPQLPAQEH